MDLIIIKKTKDYVVINKPAGLITHGAKHIKDVVSLASLLVAEFPEIVDVGDDKLRPGIVHRLDKNVSGLIVVARNQKMFDSLKGQFKARNVDKQYVALVYGKTTKDYDTIEFPLERSAKGFKMAAKPLGTLIEGNTREAITLFDVREAFINYTLLNVSIKTGRTHQIRCHLTAYGYPIVGDDLYSTKKTRIKNKKINLERIFLCATKLSFKDLDGENVKFEVEIPEELKIFLRKVK